MMYWPRQLEAALRGGPCVLVTLKRIAGSAPRESGSRMIVSADAVLGSIGGGNLEFTAIARARELLADSAAPRQVHAPYGLGPELRQCCGGAVRLLYEVLSGDCPAWLRAAIATWDEGEPAVLVQAIDGEPPRRSVLRIGAVAEPTVPPAVRDAAQALLGQEDPVGNESLLPSLEVDGLTWWLERLGTGLVPLYLFGAGHVGREVARLLERLPFRVRWVDGRPDVFPERPGGQVEPVMTEDPAAEVARAKPGGIFVVMTHSHQLDEDICFEILRRGDFRWLGLIGSATKRKRFVYRLAQRGIDRGLLERLVCPIGLPGIHGKQPATIALSLMAQLMQERPWLDAGR